jgi:signal peptidase II
LRKQFQNTLLWAALLVAIEQAIKLVVNRNLNAVVPIVPNVLYFRPAFNGDFSWFNSMLGLGVGLWVHIALTSALFLLILLAYRYCNKKAASGYIDTMFAFLIAGAFCSLIDKVFWGGSLDYILLKGFFTFDLKDVYINLFIVMVVLGLIFKNKAISAILESPKREKDGSDPAQQTKPADPKA